MHMLYSLALGVWAMYLAVQNAPLSGNYFGAVATYAILAAIVMLVGIIMTITGLRIERMITYFLYMSWLVVIMPGLFSLLHGRDDRSAAFAFAVLALFNASTSFSMIQRSLTGPWV